MAAAWFNALANPALARAVSAGTNPGQRVHPEVLEVMKEVGIDLSKAEPTLLTLSPVPELLDMLTVLVLAGLDTTRAELGYLFRHLATHDADRRRLVDVDRCGGRS